MTDIDKALELARTHEDGHDVDMSDYPTCHRCRETLGSDSEPCAFCSSRPMTHAEYPDREPQGEFVVRLWFGEDVKQMIFSGNIGADGCAMAGQSLAMLRDAL